MCFICKLRLKKLLEKGYIFDAQISEVTEEIEKEFEDAINKFRAMNSKERAEILAAVHTEGIIPNLQDFLATTEGNKTGYGSSDELIERLLKMKVNSDKVN